MGGGQRFTLGRGVNSVTTELCNWAVDHPVPEPPPDLSGRQIDFKVDLIQKSSQVRETLGISAAATFGTFIDSITATVDFYHDYVAMQFCQILLVQVNVTYEPETLDPQVMKANAQNLLKEDGAREFFGTYGDCYVSDLSHGASLYAWLEFQASSQAEYDSLTSQLSAAVGLFTADAAFNQALSKVSSIATTKLKVLKLGGNALLPGPDPQHDYPGISDLITAALAFPSEINPKDSSTFYVSDWHLTLYETAEHDPVLLDSEFPDVSWAQNALNALVTEREDLVSLKRETQYVLDNPGQFASPNLPQLTSNLAVITADLANVDSCASSIRASPFTPVTLPKPNYPSLPPLPRWLGVPHLIINTINGNRNVSYDQGTDGQYVGHQFNNPIDGWLTTFSIRLATPINGLSICYEALFRNSYYPTSPQGMVAMSGCDGAQLHCSSDGSNANYLTSIRIWLEGSLKDLFTVEYKAWLFGGGEFGPESDGVPLVAPRVEQVVCNLCTPDQLMQEYMDSYFEALWVRVGYRSGLKPVLRGGPAYRPKARILSPYPMARDGTFVGSRRKREVERLEPVRRH